MPGVGKGHSIQVQVGSDYTTDCPSNDCKAKSSVVFAAEIKYARPIVASYTVAGDPANNMKTSGNENLVVVGSNFGPIGTTVESAKYGDGTPPYAATACEVKSHTQMNCKTAAGAGSNHKLVVTIASQQSTVPAVGYGSPSLQTTECDVTGADSFKCKCVANGVGAFTSTCSGYTSQNKYYVPAVTIGSSTCSVKDISSTAAITSINNGVVVSAAISTAPKLGEYLRIGNAPAVKVAITSIANGVVVSAALSSAPQVGDVVHIENAPGQTCELATGDVAVTAADSTTGYTVSLPQVTVASITDGVVVLATALPFIPTVGTRFSIGSAPGKACGTSGQFAVTTGLSAIGFVLDTTMADVVQVADLADSVCVLRVDEAEATKCVVSLTCGNTRGAYRVTEAATATAYTLDTTMRNVGNAALCVISTVCVSPVAVIGDSTNAYSLSTRGGQRILLSGINVGAVDGTFVPIV